MGVPEVPASLRSWMSAVSEIVRSVNAAEPLASVLARVADQACELIGFTYYENLAHLDELVNTRFTFAGLPLKLRGAHGGPTRAVALIS
jgi:kynurenine formamidase